MSGLFASTDRQVHLGLFILRVGIGAAFIAHGVPKLMGGPERWTKLGGAVSNLGIDFGHQAFGLMAGLAEAGGGLLLVLGLFTRLASIAILLTMTVATTRHLMAGEGFAGAAHAIEDGIVMLALLVAGGGRHGVDGKLAGPPRWG